MNSVENQVEADRVVSPEPINECSHAQQENESSHRQQENQASNPTVRRRHRTLGSGTDNTNQLSNAPQEAAIVIKHLIYQPLKQETSKVEYKPVRQIIWGIYKIIWKKRGSIRRISVLTRQNNDAKFKKLYGQISETYSRESIYNACNALRRVILDTLQRTTPQDIQKVLNNKRRSVDTIRIYQYLNSVILNSYRSTESVKERALKRQIIQTRKNIRDKKDLASKRPRIQDQHHN